MVISRGTVKFGLVALATLLVIGILVLMFGSMASKTQQISPTEALMVETSFAESTATAETSGEVAGQDAQDRTERIETCREDVKEISEAVEESNKEGHPAGTVSQLHEAGYLDEVPKLAPVLVYTLEVSQGRPTGLVLVNGLPAPLACEF